MGPKMEQPHGYGVDWVGHGIVHASMHSPWQPAPTRLCICPLLRVAVYVCAQRLSRHVWMGAVAMLMMFRV